MGSYDTAQICLNGHLINTSYHQFPEFSKKFCSDCGEKAITKCDNCQHEIRGNYIESFSMMDKAPAYCHNCGHPYPWTLSALESAQELLSLEERLSSEELEYFSNNMPSILADTPKTKVVATKLKLALTKLSKTTAGAFRDIIVDIASESAKKIIFPG